MATGIRSAPRERLSFEELLAGLRGKRWTSSTQNRPSNLIEAPAGSSALYIYNVLKPEFGLTSEKRLKLVADTQDLSDILRFLWLEDTHRYREEPTRVTLTLFLQVLFYTAARPGVVVAAASYPGSNECLNVTLTLREDPDHSHLCLIARFLDLAFEHGAFDFEPALLYQHKLDRRVIKLEFNPHILETQLFRRGDSISPLCYNTVIKFMKGLGYRMGYNFSLTPYIFRRGAANMLDAPGATWAEMSLILGHRKPEVYQNN
ncbi:hypothetical protein G7Y89_g938 [Cudoniella acicularis]|uniref:Uncharacterized protein n=1 Tax=Cudoniella acicularis TaxID=354080 RepID=A0A8H4W9Z6_9HELO|nr:hypothetical protein G7Y89_g938 [Cudoniella acicularis]